MTGVNFEIHAIETVYIRYVTDVPHIPYSGKFLQAQTFAKMPPGALEEIFTVLIFATKPYIVQYQLGY